MNQETTNLNELKKEIIIERLMQAPPTIKISFGMSGGNFMEREELIQNVKSDTAIGKNIVNIQMAYLKAFKTGIFNLGN